MPEAPITISELPSYGSVLGTDRIPVDRLGAAVTAGAFVVDQAYQIVTVGTTSYTAIGAASNAVGVYFVATGAGSGTGTAAPINTGDAPLSAVAALLGGDPAGTAAAAVATHEAAADPHPTYTTAAELAAAIAGVSGQTQTVTIAVRNNTGSTISKGAPVYVTGSSGTTITIAPADASAEATAAETLGLTTASIANNTDGTVIAVGLLDGLNTSALTEGQIVWLSETTGAVTTTRPTQPAHGVVCGYCVKQGAGTSGILYVKVDNGLELTELHDVLVAGATAGQFLQLAADGLWKPRTLVPSDIGTMATARLLGRSAAGSGPAEEITPAGGLSIQSGNLVPSDVIKLVVSNKGETATVAANYVETTVQRACTVVGAFWELAPSATGSSSSQAMLYARRNGTKTNLLSANASLAASAILTDATSLLTGTLTLAAGDTLGVNLEQVGTGSSGHQFTVIVRYS